jgi:hypothetical protein
MATTQKAVDPAEVQSTKLELSRDNTPDSPVVQELRRQVANVCAVRELQALPLADIWSAFS